MRREAPHQPGSFIMDFLLPPTAGLPPYPPRAGQLRKTAPLYAWDYLPAVSPPPPPPLSPPQVGPCEAALLSPCELLPNCLTLSRPLVCSSPTASHSPRPPGSAPQVPQPADAAAAPAALLLPSLFPPSPPQVGLLREAALKFRSLQMLLLRRLYDNLQHQAGDESVPARERLLLLHDILDHGGPRHLPAAAATASASGEDVSSGGGGKDGHDHRSPHGHGEEEDEALVTLSDMCPLRVAFEARDAKFMAAPVVEAYTRLSWLGMEFVMETAKDGMRALSILDPSFGFVALCNLGLCSRQSASVEFTMRLWHYHVWSSQVSLLHGGGAPCASAWGSIIVRWQYHTCVALTCHIIYIIR